MQALLARRHAKRNGTAGTNKVRFSGRIDGHALKSGSYRLAATATDAAGNVGVPKMKSFRVLPRTRH